MNKQNDPVSFLWNKRAEFKKEIDKLNSEPNQEEYKTKLDSILERYLRELGFDTSGFAEN